MNLSWIANPLTIYTGVAAAAGGVTVLLLAFTMRMQLSRERKRRTAESDDVRRMLEELAGTVNEMAGELRERAALPARVPGKGLNIEKRSEALRMYRRGSDACAVAAALDIPAAEVALLEKVHRILAAEAAGGVLNRASGALVEQRSSRLEYSPEA